MPTNEMQLLVIVATVGFFLTIATMVVGFVMMRKDARKINALCAMIFLSMQRSFGEMDAKLRELLEQ